MHIRDRFLAYAIREEEEEHAAPQQEQQLLIDHFLNKYRRRKLCPIYGICLAWCGKCLLRSIRNKKPLNTFGEETQFYFPPKNHSQAWGQEKQSCHCYFSQKQWLFEIFFCNAYSTKNAFLLGSSYVFNIEHYIILHTVFPPQIRKQRRDLGGRVERPTEICT